MTLANSEFEIKSPRLTPYDSGSRCPARSYAVCETCLMRAIRFWIIRYRITPENAKDCAQEFLIKAFCESVEMLEKRANGMCSVQYVFKCAKNHAIDFDEKIRRHDGLEVHLTSQEWEEFRNSSVLTDPVQELIDEELMEMMDGMAEFLTPRQRDLYRRHFRNGESIRDIALSMKLSERSVRQSLYRITCRLRRILKRCIK